MTAVHRVLIVDNHAILRDGLRALLQSESGLEIVGEADNGRDAVRCIGSLEPDLVLMDLAMPGMNGIEAIASIRRRYPQTRILVLTIHRTDEYIHQSMRAGANGYLLKDASHEELGLAIRSVLGGKTYVSPDIAASVINRYRGPVTGTAGGEASSPWNSLTQREREVLKLVAEGHANKSIADFLFLSAKTVAKHRSNLMKKLNLHNASTLTAYAIEKGLLAA